MAIISSNLTKLGNSIDVICASIGMTEETPITTPLIESVEEAKTILSDKAVLVISGEYATLQDFVMNTNTHNQTNNADSKFVKFTDTTGWGPLHMANTQYKGFVIYQNDYIEDSSDDIGGYIMLHTQDANFYNGFVSGNKSDGISVVWNKSANKSDIDEAISALVDSAPDTMNTINELATAIKDHQDVTDLLENAISSKVDKVEGKGLSTNDYTDNEKTTLANIAADYITGDTLHSGICDKHNKKTYNTLDEFLTDFASTGEHHHIATVKITGNWAPDGIPEWYKCIVIIQNAYGETSLHPTNTTIIAIRQTSNEVYIGLVSGNKAGSTFEGTAISWSKLSKYTEVTGTLLTGDTSLTLTSDQLTTNSTIDIYASIYGVSPSSVTLINGSITLTFSAQSADMQVKVRVS